MFFLARPLLLTNKIEIYDEYIKVSFLQKKQLGFHGIDFMQNKYDFNQLDYFVLKGNTILIYVQYNTGFNGVLKITDIKDEEAQYIRNFFLSKDIEEKNIETHNNVILQENKKEFTDTLKILFYLFIGLIFFIFIILLLSRLV